MAMDQKIAYFSLGYVQFNAATFSAAGFLKNAVPSLGDLTAAGIPNGTTDIVIYVEGGALRWTDGGNTAPSATVGMLVGIGSSITFADNFNAIQFFGNAGCILNVTYYRRR